ncbi:EutN/CcmL family microcompartment protein [Schinkia azotoformans]|uniref:EutN/CcmL family microcompartment protein n=1 Tax=Schinkia azotoformans TaxID=1454 RepID=UPI002DBB8E5A|nr:EutN/CcmL family microcompartment protein [Schinkia azotoformans]MEC1717066.1 EutN/CcmL family microcompartment protein [Schinkia azotoformans]MEC1741880.1 EutN/CcmL family microcompartment protein [Schinkia azotoformans]MEC1747439.1 EutN/CcmL family microcompartment protein [Schinkia azotoformans]MEC1758122.1 EutN/CcmL family microcompartment protein [Schinkia azotoformans]MEC1766478.1 EutN/CcmL family microcompartment protein [Schinkia azotoformans]
MVIGTVLGSIWATRKEDGLTGGKLLKVKLDHVEPDGACMDSILVAADRIGAGTGDKVIVTRGTPASKFNDQPVPIDALIIGIIDPEE